MIINTFMEYGIRCKSDVNQTDTWLLILFME